MMDRTLVAEFPELNLQDNAVADDGSWEQITTTDYTVLPGTNGQYWFNEMKLDLSGYTLDDLTVYFRNSFEQFNNYHQMQWNATTPNPLKPFDAIMTELTILSSVPFTQDNLIACVLGSPGFIRPNIPTLDFGNFNRTHIIHGTSILWGIDATIGSDLVRADGAGYARVVARHDFSSLEPTAAENIYCYRVMYLPEAVSTAKPSQLDVAYFPSKRVILNCMIDKEADLEYMMRLKRSYELANQV